jgi:tripartite-type tricarboxylate transporter receptor subunit TctC
MRMDRHCPRFPSDTADVRPPGARSRDHRGRLVALLCIGLFVSATAAAQGYPFRPLRIIVPAAPGGAPDLIARLIASEIGIQMKQQVIVENRPGAAGILGFEATARASPDGYTLGFASFPIATNPAMFKRLPYDALRDFQMVVQFASGVNLLTASPTLPIKSVRELVNAARSSPGKLAFGSSGNGTSMHLSMELFKQLTDTDLMHVPYKAIQQAIVDTISGQLHVVCDNMGSILPHVKQGRLHALAVTTSKRSHVLPDLPTVAEQGVVGYEITPWSGFMVPAAVPRAIVSRLNAEINKAIFSITLETKYFAASGSTPVGGTPEQFAGHVGREIEKWSRVLSKAGIRPD